MPTESKKPRTLRIRPAKEMDIPRLMDILNHEVIDGTATFDAAPWSIYEMGTWVRAHNKGNHPLIVAELDGGAVGFASLSSYRDKDAYSSTVELSVYVAEPYRGRGLAEALMRELIAFARKRDDTHAIVSVITSGNEASIHLHEKLAFEYCGRLREIGFKFGRYWDTVSYQLIV